MTVVNDSEIDALQPTEFFDYESDEVQDFIRKAAPADELPVQRLKKIYSKVRDSIAYNPYQIPLTKEYYKASRICRMRRAYCIPKSLLFATCARALGFRSWIGFADVVNHLSSKRFVEYLKTNVFAFHGYAVVEINGQKIKATPVFDARLCHKYNVPVLDFDGEHDALFQSYDKDGHQFMEYVKERGEYTDFPFDKVITGLQDMYPHLIGRQVDGDFMHEDRA